MEIRSAVEQYARAVGEEIANSDDVIQSDLLNGFFEMFIHSVPSSIYRDSQIAGITHRLSPRSKKVLIRFAEFCEDPE